MPIVEESLHSDAKQLQPGKISIMLVDDHPLIRQALRSVLDKYPEFQVIAEAGDGEAAVNLAKDLLPDIVIMDISMPKMNGIDSTREIKAKCPNVRILALTVHNEIENVLEILSAGADGYLMKSIFGVNVVNAIRGVTSGETVLSPEVSRQLIRYVLRYPTKPLSINSSEKLTTRELEILGLAAGGMSNKEIALNLNLSLHTIKCYLSDIFTKMGVGSRTEAVVTAMRAGYLPCENIEP